MNPPSQDDDERYPLVARRDRPTSVIPFGPASIGGRTFAVIAGPCAVESSEQIETTARLVADAGAIVLRGGVFKPRTSPYTFQGMGLEGLKAMRRAADLAGLPLVTEVPSARHIEAMTPLVDAFQVGSRNMQNFDLLRALGDADRPLLLKRGFGATAEEWLNAAEYVAHSGNEEIVLCERGIRTFSESTRFTLDLTGALWVKRRTHLPVVVDPSHATGLPELVDPVVRAAVAAGLDGAIIEVHHEPRRALCDADQALDGPSFSALMSSLSPLCEACQRPLAAGGPKQA